MKRYYGWMFFIFAVIFLAASLYIMIIWLITLANYLLLGDARGALLCIVSFFFSWVAAFEFLSIFFSWICFIFWYRWSIMSLFEADMVTYIPEVESRADSAIPHDENYVGCPIPPK